MAKNKIAYYTQSGRVAYATVTGTAITDVISAGAEGSKVVGISIVSSLNTDIPVIYYYDGSTSHIIWKKTLTSDAINYDVLNDLSLPKAPNGSKYFNIPAGTKIQISTSIVDTLEVAVFLEDY